MKMRTYWSPEEMNGYISAWAEKLPGYVTIEEIGESGGYPILAAIFTAPEIPKDEKEVALILAQHSVELSGVTSVLSLGNFLAAGGPRAMEIMRRQIVVLVPCSNIYSYAQHSPDAQFKNEAGIDEYVAFGYEGVKNPEQAPVASAIQRLIDHYRPELLLDCHGTWFETAIGIETFGYSSLTLNTCYDRSFCNEVQSAAESAGYATFSLDSLQRLQPTQSVMTNPSWAARYQRSRDNAAVAGIYAYHQYHTIGGTFEISWEESGFLRVLRALELGCKQWGDQNSPGYPVRALMPQGHALLNGLIADGENAARRRDSRVEIWQHMMNVNCGIMHPEQAGLSVFFVSTSAAKCERVFGGQWYGKPMDQVLQAFAREGIETSALEELVAGYPETYEVVFPAEEKGEYQIQNGYALRIGIPFADATIKRVLLNGKALYEDGYAVSRIRNWTYVDIHVPAGLCPDLAIGAVQYDYSPKPQGILQFKNGSDVYEWQ